MPKIWPRANSKIGPRTDKQRGASQMKSQAAIEGQRSECGDQRADLEARDQDSVDDAQAETGRQGNRVHKVSGVRGDRLDRFRACQEDGHAKRKIGDRADRQVNAAGRR